MRTLYLNLFSHWSNVICSLISRNKVWFGRGSERLGAFAKPNILNIECMRKRSNFVVHGEVHGADHGAVHGAVHQAHQQL